MDLDLDLDSENFMDLDLDFRAATLPKNKYGKNMGLGPKIWDNYGTAKKYGTILGHALKTLAIKKTKKINLIWLTFIRTVFYL